jgi:hypothetical protein
MPSPEPKPPELVLGPLLRHVDPVSATVWVEVDRSCEVAVLGRTARSFRVGSHHFALVVVDGLQPGSSTPYDVRLDGESVWPPARSALPPSRIRTPGAGGTTRIAFGSCRYASPATVDPRQGIPPDALQTYARRMATQPEDQWPDALALLGDQVYADELTPTTRRWLSRRRRSAVPEDAQMSDFDGYSRLYAESWTDPEVRWLLSTVPSSMIFDDHEVIDDWNTSAAWRAGVSGRPWWHRRIRAAMSSYWVYQHLGNLSLQELADDPTWQAVTRAAASSEDAEPILAAMAVRADTEPHAVRWSYLRHWGDVAMVVIDSRAGRVLEERERRMTDDEEFAWVEATMRRAVEDGVAHLIIGTSLPWLLPHGIHFLERWNETLAARHVGRWRGRLAEKLRQAADLEHWAAFGDSFEQLGDTLVEVASGKQAPATVLVLSGDVHHAYAAELVRPDGRTGRIHQLTVSPLHNQAPHPIQVGFRLGWSRAAKAFAEFLARSAHARPSAMVWTKEAGPFFGNQIGELVLTGREARFRLSVTEVGRRELTEVLDLPLSPE